MTEYPPFDPEAAYLNDSSVDTLPPSIWERTFDHGLVHYPEKIARSFASAFHKTCTSDNTLAWLPYAAHAYARLGDVPFVGEPDGPIRLRSLGYLLLMTYRGEFYRLDPSESPLPLRVSPGDRNRILDNYLIDDPGLQKVMASLVNPLRLRKNYWESRGEGYTDFNPWTLHKVRASVEKRGKTMQDLVWKEPVPYASFEEAFLSVTQWYLPWA